MPRKLRCSVSSITDHGGHVYTVDLASTVPVPSFRPGQFLHLTVDAYDPASFWPESRVFSIASSPKEHNHLRICYSVKGSYTTKMEQVLKCGSTAWVKLPYGDFFVDDSSDAVLVAGGTGISAYAAFLEALTPEIPRKVTLVYGARAPGLFLFQDMILSKLANVPGFNVIFFTETADPGFSRRLAELPKPPQCFTGRISLDTVICLQSSDLRLLTSVFYLSGPPGMIKVLGTALHAQGIPLQNTRNDAWE